MIYTNSHSEDSYYKSILFGFIIGSILCLLISCFAIYAKPRSMYINDDILDQYLATCKINTESGQGTGVLLESGYILTAAHLIGKNDTSCDIIFYSESGIARVESATLIYVCDNPDLDFAIIQPTVPQRSNIKIAEYRPKIGDKIYSIGCPKNTLPHITKGFESTPTSLMDGRASISAYMGASGGGVFNDKNEIVGVVNGVGFMYRVSPIRATAIIKNDLAIITGRVRYWDVIPQWTEYTRMSYIKQELKSRNLSITIDSPKYNLDLTATKYTVKTLSQLLIIILFTFFLGYKLTSE